MSKEKMNIVIVGHVDHGKSTVIGRLLADTKSLPEGKLEQVKAQCARNAKPFEYAFLLDALKDEQSQGITIDMARCFFKSSKRDYIIIDAPGHIEFLKNMVTGAARAEAAILVIDAAEGICENSKRHGYLLSMLGIRQVVVCVNKMDLVNYDKSIFDNIQKEYSAFLDKIGVKANAFLPVSAVHGENITQRSQKMMWNESQTILETLDAFEKEKDAHEKPFRFFLQDIYKFTNQGDDRRIFAGRVETGQLNVGDQLIFFPSKKKTKVASLEGFNERIQNGASAGKSTGFTVTEQIYAQRGEMVCKLDDVLPKISSRFRANIFWMGKEPMVSEKNYFLKIGALKVPVKLKKILLSIDVVENLDAKAKKKIERHDVVECIFETSSLICFDLNSEMKETSRFVIVDNYEISGGGIILESLETDQSTYVKESLTREVKFERGHIVPNLRSARYHQKPALILINGDESGAQKTFAKDLEKYFFEKGRYVYYMGFGSLKYGLDTDILLSEDARIEYLRRLSEVAYLMMDAGLIIIASLRELEDLDRKMVQTLAHPYPVLEITTNRIDKQSDDDKSFQISTGFKSDIEIQKIESWLIEHHCLLDFSS